MPKKHVRIPQGGLEEYLGPIDETPYTAPKGNPLPPKSPPVKTVDWPMFERAGDIADPSKYRYSDERDPDDSEDYFHLMHGREPTHEERSDPSFTYNVLRDEKLTESKQSDKHRAGLSPEHKGLYESIAAEGVREPVTVSTRLDYKLLSEGHHRVFAANDINPEMMVPVEIYDPASIRNGKSYLERSNAERES